MDRLLKVATPAEAAWVSVPDSVPLAGLAPMARVTLAVLAVRLLNWSRIWTVTAGLIDAPATVVVGCWLMASLFAAAAVMVKEPLLTLVRVPLVAVRV